MAAKTDKDKKAIKKTETVSFFRKHLYAIIVFSVSFALYLNTIPNGYNLDDELVTRNHKLTSQGISAIPEIFTSPYYKDDMGYSYGYRPVLHTTFAIENQFFGESPHTGHFFNTLIYAILCTLLFIILQLILPGSGLLPLLAALLFAAHPIHTEVVASIKNRDELLMFLFSSLSMYTILRWGEKSFLKALSLSVFLFTVAMLSKNSALPFAVLIPITLIFFRNVSFGKFGLLSVLLIIPAVSLLENNKLVFTLQIAAVILMGNTLLYALINFLKNTEAFTKAIRQLSRPDGDEAGAGHSAIDGGVSIRFYKPSGLQWPLLIAVYAALLLSVYAMVFNLWWLLYAAIVVVFAYGFFSRHRTNLLYIIPVFITLLLLMQKVDEKWMALCNITAAFLLVLLYVADRKSKVYIFALSLVFCLQWAIINNDSDFLFFAILGIGIVWRRYFIYTTGFILSILIIATPIEVYKMLTMTNGYYSSYVFTLALAVIIALWVYRKYAVRNLVLTAAGLLLFSAIVQTAIYVPALPTSKNNVFTYLQKEESEKYIQERRNRLDKVEMPKAVSIATDRPLNFVEIPVSLSDPLEKRIAVSSDILLRYFKLLVIPHPLIFYYGYSIIKPVDITTPVVIISILLHLILFAVALLCVRRLPVIAWSLLSYLIFMAALSNVLQSIPGMMGERYLLVPSFGFCIIISWLLLTFLNKVSNGVQRDKVIKWSFGGIIVLYGILTINRNSIWKDDIRLFSHDIVYAEKSAQAHNLLAIHLIQKSFTEVNPAEQNESRLSALQHFKKAKEIYPSFFNVAYDIGRTYTMLQMYDSAIVAFKYASTLDTNFYNIQSSISDLYYSNGQYAEAVPYLEYMIRKVPSYYPSYEKLSYILFLQKKYIESVNVNRLAIKNIPGIPDPYINIARTYIGQNMIDSARYYGNEAYKIAPSNQMANDMVRQLGKGQ